MSFILNLVVETGGLVWQTFLHNWPFLVVSALLATVLKLFLDPTKVSAFLLRHQKAGVVGATAAAVATPLCSCGTTAVLLGMIANYMPWAPIVAFMVASPLTSPQELVYSAGLFGWRFALAFFAASIFLGLAGGAVAGLFDRRGWLANQTRQALRPGEIGLETAPTSRREEPGRSGRITSGFQITLPVLQTADCACSAGDTPRLAALEGAGPAVDIRGYLGSGQPAPPSCCADASLDRAGVVWLHPATSGAQGLISPQVEDVSLHSNRPERKAITPSVFLRETLTTGWRLLVLFLTFAFIGYLLNGLIPAAWVAAIFGSGNAFSVPLAATLGLPLYVNTEASLPLVLAMLESGMSEGAALAFLITGAGTSIGAVTGILTIARWRVIALVVATLWVGAVLTGLLYNLM